MPNSRGGYAGPSLRDRLFRPNRWRLWVQFALLGAFILIIPILLTSSRLLNAGRQVLVDHEVIDLSDESNLRVNEMREDLAYLARDVRRGILHADAAIVPAVYDEVQPLPASHVLPAMPSTVRESRQRYMPGTIVGIVLFRVNGGVVEILEFKPGPDETESELSDAAKLCLGDIAARTKREHPSYDSNFHLQAKSGLQPARCLVVVGGLVSKKQDPGKPLIAAVILNFSKYIDNRRRISPRHAYIVTDPQGTILVYPDPEVALGQEKLSDRIPWDYPKTEQGESWFTRLPTEAERDRRLAIAVHSGGARLPMIPVPELECDYRKGWFGDTLEKLWGTAADERAIELNQLLAQETARDPLLRCGQVLTKFNYIEVAHRDPVKLQRICDLISEWFRTRTPGKKISWTPDLKCKTFQGQLTPLRVSLNDEDEVAWLVVAASREELQEDIDMRFQAIQNRWVLPTIGIASLLGIGLVVMLTYSVRRLARAARNLDLEHDEMNLPLGGPYEVSQLAYTLTELAQNVAERDRELRDRAARYETILRAAGEGIIITRGDGTIEEANKAAGRMFGVKPEKLIGKTVSGLVTNPEALVATDSSMQSMQGMTTSLDTVQGIRLDGSTFWMEYSMRPVLLRNRTVVTCVFRDITQRKEDEERIGKLNENLEKRVLVRTAELEEAKVKLEVALKQAEAASKAKDTFVANMSHELRQPLHIIIGFTEALKEEAEDLGASDIIPDLNKILSAARHLLELINDILDMAKISAGRMELSLSRFDIPKMIEDVRTLVSPLAEKNKNQFEIDIPADLGTMIADERRVRQILINLLSNAFKFTDAGTISLKVRKISEGGRPWVRFTLTDTGKGMSAEEVARLFQRFYQADSTTTREKGGTGLGLAITQSFTELMNGLPIRVNSEVGKGSEFIVTLPVEVHDATLTKPQRTQPALPPTLIPAAETSEEKPHGQTVLVIDDDPMVRELMSRFLVKDGFRVVQAESGEEGLKLARELMPAVITLDVMMPGMDGWNVIAKIKEDEVLHEIPVVMLTIVDDRGRGFSLGATDYLTKPIDWQRLGAILKRYLVPGRNNTVLVIDDVEANREVIRRFLERNGCNVIEAVNGEEGIRAVIEQQPALVMLDLMMPVMDGFGFLDELDRREPNHRVPVIVLTAKDLTAADFDKLNGRVARILEKGDLSHLDKLLELIRSHARKGQ